MTNKTEAPERIWASTGLYYDYVTDWSEGSWDAVAGDGVLYIRADLSDALKDKRIAELEAELYAMTEDRNIISETSQQQFIRIAELEAKLHEETALI